MNRINNPDYHRAKKIHEFTVMNLQNELIKLDVYKGFMCIVVNIAIKSPLTAYNYKHFNELMDKFGDKLRILAFPCNQFAEECGSPEEIASHAEKNNVKFEIFATVDVNGEGASDVWKFLKHSLSTAKTTKQGDLIKSSYTKFIINRFGVPVERYGPDLDPAKFEDLLTPFF